MLNEKKIEGYWYSKYQPSYPKPIRDELSEEEAVLISNQILKVQRKSKKKLYRGPSFSRIDGSILGCAEYETDQWIWPADFASHYVLKYKVKPSGDFLSYIFDFDK